MMIPQSVELGVVLQEVSLRHNDSTKWKRTVLQVQDLTSDTGWSGNIATWDSSEKLTEGKILGAIKDSNLMARGAALTFQLEVQHKKGGNRFPKEFVVRPEESIARGVDQVAAVDRAVVTNYSRNIKELSDALIKSHELVTKTAEQGAQARKIALDERENQFSKFVALMEGFGTYGFVPVSTAAIAGSIFLLKKAGVDPIEYMALINDTVSRAEIALKQASNAMDPG